MSNAAIIALAIAVAVVLAAVVFVTTARRSDVRGAGALSSETRQRDEAARRARSAAEGAATATAGSDVAGQPGTAVAVLTADEAERAGDQARRPTPVLAPPAAPAPWVPPDPEVIGVSRRQFFNRATVTLMATSIGAFTVAGFVAFLWPTKTGGFGQVVSVGKLEDILEGARANSGFFYAPSARTWITEYPAEALPDAETVYDPAIFEGMRDYGLVALYQKCPHLGCRVPGLRVESLVRMPVPRFAVQPGRREEGWTGAARDGPLQHQRRRCGQRERRHRHRLHRTADRHEHNRPGSRRTALHHRSRRTLMLRPRSFVRCAHSLHSDELAERPAAAPQNSSDRTGGAGSDHGRRGDRGAPPFELPPTESAPSAWTEIRGVLLP